MPTMPISITSESLKARKLHCSKYLKEHKMFAVYHHANARELVIKGKKMFVLR